VSSRTNIPRIGLGTVQFGIDYGISNSAGKVEIAEVKNILSKAADAGLVVIDTASGYGNSEAVLGESFPPEHNFKIITKTPACGKPECGNDFVKNIDASFSASLKNMQQKNVYGILLHHGADALKPGGKIVLDHLNAYKKRKLCQKVGVSVYSVKELDGILDIFTPDIVQLPVNILDQRFIKSGQINKLKKLGVEIHARSLFLQGALLMDKASLPNYFSPVKNNFYAIYAEAEKIGISKLDICLLFALQQDELDALLVGVTSWQELSQIFESFERISAIPKYDFSSLALDDEKYVNPSNWEV